MTGDVSPWQFRRLSDKRASLGESPVWSPEDESVWWVDITGGMIFRTDVLTGATREWRAPEQVGCIAFTTNGCVLAGMVSGLFLLQPQGEDIGPIVTPSPRSDVRFNDAAVDPAGRFFAGTMHLDNAAPVGAIYRFDADLSMSLMFDGFYTPNGLAFDPLRQRMYVSDSHPNVQTIWVCDYDVGTGTPHNRRVFARTHGWRGRPDGAAVDAMGNYWIAAVDGGQVWCFSPAGERLRSIDVGVSHPTKLAFGGSDLDRVFLTSKAPSPELDRGADDLGGYLLTADADIAGSPPSAVILEK